MSISLLVTAMACGDDDGGDVSDDTDDTSDDGTDDDGTDVDAGGACEVAEWAAPDFATNAETALALRAQLDLLTGNMGLMRGAEQELKGSEVDDVADLTAIYEGGDPSFAGNVTERYDAIMDDAFADFVALVGASAQDLIDDTTGAWTPGAAGGLAGTSPRGINAGGLEIRQIADKGLFAGAGLYGYALTLTEGEITPATIDALAATWGGNDALGTGEGELTDSANYSFGMGFHAAMAEALAAAKSYAADEACATERDEAIVAFFRAWEQSMVARTIYYSNAAAALIAGAVEGPDGEEDKIDALHELSEGIGLTFGFLGLPEPAAGPLADAGRLLSDDDVAAMMLALGVDIADLSASTTGTFVEEAALLTTGVAAFEAIAIEVFGLSDADIAAYRTPTEG